MMFCPNCGAQTRDGAVYCPRCGTAMGSTGSATSSAGISAVNSANAASPAAGGTAGDPAPATASTGSSQGSYHAYAPAGTVRGPSDSNIPNEAHPNPDNYSSHSRRPAPAHPPVQRHMSAAQLPPQYRPLGAWAYFGYSILFAIPLVGFILLIVFSFDDSNINRRNFARSHWCAVLVSLIIVILIVALMIVFGISLSSLSNLYS